MLKWINGRSRSFGMYPSWSFWSHGCKFFALLVDLLECFNSLDFETIETSLLRSALRVYIFTITSFIILRLMGCTFNHIFWIDGSLESNLISLNLQVPRVLTLLFQAFFLLILQFQKLGELYQTFWELFLLLKPILSLSLFTIYHIFLLLHFILKLRLLEFNLGFQIIAWTYSRFMLKASFTFPQTWRCIWFLRFTSLHFLVFKFIGKSIFI